MKLLVRSLILIAGFAAVRLAAQVAGPSPLVGDSATAQVVPGGWMLAEGRADRALQTGFPATAAAGYRELLREPAVPADVRQRMTLALVTALLDAGETAAAEAGLQGYDGPRNAAYQLRAGLIAATNRRTAQAKVALAAGKIDDLPVADRGWWLFLQAAVADLDADFVRANAFYEQAARAAVSELQRARFVLGQEQLRLRSGKETEAQLAPLRESMDRQQGTRQGYVALRTYATALFTLGRAAEAQAVLQRQLAVLPSSERGTSDQLHLMLGLIAGERSGAGRLAFNQLLRDGLRPETQRLALQLLARGAQSTAEREQLRRDLTELIDPPAPHPIIEDLLLVRAQAALLDKDYARAEEDARALLERYPGSPLKAPALGVRLAVAWDLKRYRTAADVVAQLRAIIPEGRERAQLGVLLAEAFFRSGEFNQSDYQNAADAYDAALREAPQVVPAGGLIFQRVLADIRSERLDAAAKLLDEVAANPAFDPVNRWQAEWNLVKEMQVRGQAQAAYGRVDRLLAGGAQGVPEELRIRLMWLRAKLSFDNGQPESTLRQADELLALLQAAGPADRDLRSDVTSNAQLLKAQALLALDRDKEGFAMLDKLRADFATKPAAQSSYLVQAGHLTQRGDIAGAQVVLKGFVDAEAYKQSEYAPVALFDAALNEERLGLPRQLEDGYRLLERLISNYPRDELVFYARLKQADFLRKLNNFAAARQIYENLINNQGQHPDILLAQLALANTLFAQGANSVTNYESASVWFERLSDIPSAPVDLRAEAGFMWGYALAKRAQSAGTPAERDQQNAKAQTVFWSVVDRFLLDSAAAAKLGAKGRHWVSRVLLALGQMNEDAGRLDEAQRAYQLIVDNKLSGIALAQEKLGRYRLTAGAKP